MAKGIPFLTIKRFDACSFAKHISSLRSNSFINWSSSVFGLLNEFGPASIIQFSSCKVFIAPPQESLASKILKRDLFFL